VLSAYPEQGMHEVIVHAPFAAVAAGQAAVAAVTLKQV
jgi:hypothetical protein